MDIAEEERFIEAQEAHDRRINLLPEPSAELLNPRQARHYLKHRSDFVDWLLHFGKAPDEAEGYAYATVLNRAKYHDQFARWVWSERGYTLDFTHEDADDYLDRLHYDDQGASHKSNTQKALRNLFEWDGDGEWEPRRHYRGESGRSSPKEYLKRKERKMLEEAALEYGSVPSYNSLSGDELHRFKHLLAERFRKPLDEIGKADFQRANGFKTPSIIFSALDAGFRPVEIGRAKVGWVDIANGAFVIPEPDSSKNRDNWTVALRDQTVDMLEMWLKERECYPQYEDSPYLWLTRDGNQYGKRTCNYLIDRLFELTPIENEQRELSWYAIRHSTGTYMSNEGGLKDAADQLRHKSLETTKRYDQSPPEERKNTLEQI